MELKDLSDCGLVYLASPYSKYPDGIEVAFKRISLVAANCLRAGVRVYSPIVHCHPISMHGGIDALDHAIWIPFNLIMVQKSDVLLVAMMDTWDASFGVTDEIKKFVLANKPIYYLDPNTLMVSQRLPRYEDQ